MSDNNENSCLLADLQKVKDSAGLQRGAHTVEFLAAKEEILAALQAGFPMKSIWRVLVETGRLSCSYEAFVRNVKKYKLRHSV